MQIMKTHRSIMAPGKNTKASLLMLGAVISSVLIYFFPLWKITLYAPQYPQGIRMYIWIHKITGDDAYTLQNINILNHYVGMKDIDPHAVPELHYFPYVLAGIILLGLIAWLMKKRWLYLSWALLYTLAGTVAIYDFYRWEYDYGHHLDPKAPIKVPGMAYQPPLIGLKHLLNFTAISLPERAAGFMLISIILGFAAYWCCRSSSVKEQINQINAVPADSSRASVLLPH
jgi:copper chaperone NosL